MKLVSRILSSSLLSLLLSAWVCSASSPARAADAPPAYKASAGLASTPAPTPATSPSPKAASDAAKPAVAESRKAHPISDIFVVGPPVEPTPTPEPTPPPEGLRPPVFAPPSAAGGTGSVTNPGDLATSLSLVPRATPPPLPPLPAIPSHTPAATPPPVAALPDTASAAPAPLASTPAAAGATPAPAAAAPVAAAANATPLPSSGKVDLNSAPAAELAALPGLDINRANLIIAHRKSIGGFRDVEQLREVYGISEKILLRLMPLVAIGPYTPPPPAIPWSAPLPVPQLVSPVAGHAQPSSGTAVYMVSPPSPPSSPASAVEPEGPSLPVLPAAAATAAPETGNAGGPLGDQSVIVIPSNLVAPSKAPGKR